MASKDFIVKNGLRIGGSSGTGSLTAGDASFLTSLSATALSGAAGAGLTTGATISLAGDLGGSVSLDTLDGTKTLTATIQANSVALGTDTTGSYLESFALNTTVPSLTGTIGTGEGATVTGLGLSATGVTANSYGSSTAIPVVTVLEDGRISALSTAAISTDLTIAADSGSNDTVSIGTDTLTFAGTSNEIETTVTNNQIQIGLPNNVTIAGNLTVNGTCTTLNTEVTSTTTATENNFVIVSTDDGADAAPDLKLYRNSSSPANDDRIGNLIFTGRNDNSQDFDFSQITTRITDVRDSCETSYLTLKTANEGTLAERLTIKGGLVGIGTTNPNEELTVVGTLSASTSMVSPIANGTTCVDGPLVCGTTKVCSPIIAGSTCVDSPLLCGTTKVCSPIIAGSTCVDSALICGTTASFAGGYGSTGITIATDGDICSSGKISIGTTAQNADLTIAGTLSASGIIYADAFTSTTGNSTIDFNDNVDLAGTLTLSSGLNAGTTDSILIEDSGVVKKRTVDSRVWGSTLIDGSGTANRIAKFSDGDTIADSTISDDGSDIILGTTNTTVKVDDDATAGSIQFNGNKSAFHTTTCTINNAASGVLVSIPVANYRTGKIIISAKGASACTSHVETTEILMIHDGTNAYTTEYATIRSGDAVGEYIGVKVGTNIELRACNDLGGSATATFVTAIQHLTV